jgi:hypothetical protein
VTRRGAAGSGWPTPRPAPVQPLGSVCRESGSMPFLEALPRMAMERSAICVVRAVFGGSSSGGLPPAL